jgi:hypothetical protein
MTQFVLRVADQEPSDTPIAGPSVASRSSKVYRCLKEGRIKHKRIELGLKDKKFAAWLSNIRRRMSNASLVPIAQTRWINSNISLD